MDSMLVSKNGFPSVKEATEWANNQIGLSVSGRSHLVIKNIVQFQIVPEAESLSVVLLVEIEKKRSMSSMVISMRKDLNLSQPNEGDED